MKIAKSKPLPRANIQEIIIIVVSVGIVAFVLYAIYKNVSNISGIRSINGFAPPVPYKEAFSGSGTRHSLEYSSYPTNEAIDSKKNMLIETTPSKPQCGKVWGLNGLFCTPYLSDNLLDVFYSAKSDMSCEGSELSKGQGNLCLDKTQRALLSSRGGNADTMDHFKS